MISAQDLVALAIACVRDPTSTAQTGDTELARALDLGVNGRDAVKRWREGRSAPNYSATIALLELVGALNPDALKPGLPADVMRRAEGLKKRTRAARDQLREEQLDRKTGS